jgi:hypothetical protein
MDGVFMNAYELADELQDLHGLYCEDAANMLRQQADRIAELEKEVLMWENAEVPTEVMADLIQELERRKFITTPQIKELSDEEIEKLQAEHTEKGHFADTLNVKDFARAILKKANEK